MIYRHAPDVTHEISGERAVLLAPDGTTMLTLNPVGSVIWQEINGLSSLEHIAETLTERFVGVTIEQLRTDIEDFIAELVADGLVVVV